MAEKAIQLRTLTHITDEQWFHLRTMWLELYRLQEQQGMLVPLPENADQLWMESLKPSMGRFSWIHVAEDASAKNSAPKIVGFIAARTRTMPRYFGGERVGFISDVYVSPEARGLGLGRKLMEYVQKHYLAAGIRRIELQVMPANESARKLYLSLGWKEELLQMVIE